MGNFSLIIQFAKRLGIAFLIFSLGRLFFYIFNASYFPNAGVGDFLYGLRFDGSAIAWIYSPFILFSVLPFNFRIHPYYQGFLKFWFYLSTILCIVLNGIDLEYYKFTLKRTTSDLLDLMQMGDDVSTLLPTFIADFWYVVLISIGLLVLTEWLYRKTKLKFDIFKLEFKGIQYIYQTLMMIASLAVVVILSRGGLQLIPISVIDAGFYTKSENVPLVLNTPFSFMKSLENQNLKEVDYMTIEEAQHLIQLEKKGNLQDTIGKYPNIVILVLESFSNEYIGFFNPESSFTPNLDKLLEKSLVFDRCFANGKKSIEGIPAITAALPTLMDNPFISSPYSTNQFNSFPSLLKKIGYSSSFYHGGTNGTMGFEAFCEMAGFDKYIGMSQYPDKERDYDGNWGIFDEPFMQFFAEELSKEKEPFFSTFFSLSSHHPYTIPEQHQGKFKSGDLPILQSVMYTDYALNEFFKTAQRQPWFQNTLFVITADHTSKLESLRYNNNVGNYAIPLAIYYPSKDSIYSGINHNVTQQIDILPSVLNEINYPTDYISFGNDFKTTNKDSYSISFLNGKYQFIQGNYALQYNDPNFVKLYNYATDVSLSNDIASEQPQLANSMQEKLKAFVQLYNTRMINNQLKNK